MPGCVHDGFHLAAATLPSIRPEAIAHIENRVPGDAQPDGLASLGRRIDVRYYPELWDVRNALTDAAGKL